MIIKNQKREAIFEPSPTANLKEAVEEAVKAEVNLFGADLCRADLFEADLRDANLFGADLKGANLCDIVIQ